MNHFLKLLLTVALISQATAAEFIPKKLSQLLDVHVVTPLNGHILQYDSGTSKWVNVTIPGASFTLTGDVTGTGSGSVATTIGAGKVTNAMLAGSIDLTTKVTGSLPVVNGGLANTTIAANRASYYWPKGGLANGAAVLAATPDVAGQFVTSSDGYIGWSYGTGAGNVYPVMLVDGTLRYILGDTRVNAGSLDVQGKTTGGITVGGLVTTGNAIRAWNNNIIGAPQIIAFTNNAAGLSAIELDDYSGTGGMTFIHGEGGAGGGYANMFTIEPFFGLDGTATSNCAPLVIRTFGKDGGVTGARYRLQCKSNGDNVFYKYTSADLLDAAGPSLTLAANGAATFTSSVTASSFSGPLTGAVTGNVTGNLTGNASTVTTNANLTGDVTSSGNATTVGKVNGVSLAGLATGLLKNTTTTGVPSIAVAGTDYYSPSWQTFTRGTGTVTVATTGYVDITGLSAAIGANETWVYRIMVPITGATNGCKFQVTGPASPTAVQIFYESNITTLTGAQAIEPITAFSTPTTTAVHSTAVTGYSRFDILVVNGSNAGTVQLQFATASGTNTITALANRYIEGTRKN